MIERKFSRWCAWNDRHLLAHIERPGVYAIAITDSPLAGKTFRWRQDIIYIGVTTSLGGLRARLRQFDQTMRGESRHGGAERVRRRHRSYRHFSRRAFVSVVAFNCDPRVATPATWRRMGDVLRFEYLCIAEFLERFDQLPRFNDKKRSPKLPDEAMHSTRKPRTMSNQAGR